MNHEQLRIVADLIRDGKITEVERIKPGSYFVVVYVLRRPADLGAPSQSGDWTWTAHDRAERLHFWDLGPRHAYSHFSVRVIWHERGRVTAKTVASDGPMPRTVP